MMVWLGDHLETLLVITVLAAVGVVVFRNTLAVYNHIFFSARALRNSLIKTMTMVLLLFLIYAIPRALFRVVLPDGWLQSLSLVITIVLFDVVWVETGRWLDRLIT